MLSIIIPTLNEEKYLPLLLNSIKKQDFTNYEIIVADNNSRDKTREIAKSFGCKIVQGGLPAEGRNRGAKLAKGDILLFLDADVILPERFLTNTIKEFKARKLGLATTYQKPISKNIADHILITIFNILYGITQFVDPHASGYCIFAKRTVHKKLNGFREDLKLGEDHNYVKRGSKIAKFRILKSAKIYISMRRFISEGRLKLVLKYLKSEMHRKLKGEITKEIFEYKYDQSYK